MMKINNYPQTRTMIFFVYADFSPAGKMSKHFSIILPKQSVQTRKAKTELAYQKSGNNFLFLPRLF